MSTALVAAANTMFPGDPRVQALRNALPNYKAAERVVMGMMRTAMTNERKMIGLTKAWHKFQTWHRLGGGNTVSAAASRKRGRQPGLLNLHRSLGWRISSHLDAKNLATIAQVRKANNPFANALANHKQAMMQELEYLVARGKKALKQRKWRDVLRELGSTFSGNIRDNLTLVTRDIGQYFQAEVRTTIYQAADPYLRFASFQISLLDPEKFIAYYDMGDDEVEYNLPYSEIIKPHPRKLMLHVPDEWVHVINGLAVRRSPRLRQQRAR